MIGARDKALAPDPALPPEQVLWALASLCRLYRLPFDARMILQQFPGPYRLSVLVAAAQALGFRTRMVRRSPASLRRSQLPCLGLVSLPAAPQADDEPPAAADGATPDSANSKKTHLAIVVERNAEEMTYFVAGANVPQRLNVGDHRRFARWSVLIFPTEAHLPDADFGPAKRPFGFRSLLPELLRHRRIWRDVLLASFAIQVMGLATPLFTQVVIDKVIVHQTVNTLVAIAVALLVFIGFSAAMSWSRQYLVLHTGNRIDAVLGARVLRHLFRLPLRYFDHRPTGTLVARVQAVETIREFVTGAAVSLLLDLPFLFVFLAVMFYYSLELTLVALSVLAGIAIMSLSLTPLLRSRLDRQFQLGARNQAFLTEYVSGVETVKSLQMEPHLEERFGGYLAGYLEAAFGTRRLANTYSVSANALEQLQTLGILAAGAWKVMHDPAFTVGMLVAFQMFASRLASPVLNLVGLWQQFQQASIGVKRLGDIMNAPAEPYAVRPTRSPSQAGRLWIEGLSFRYGPDRPLVFEHLGLTVEPGQCVAVTGPSGSGKSTLTRLLQGFYQPEAGRIVLDGRDIRHLSANELRQYFGVVPQETVLFSGTVYENLVIANPHAGFTAVVQACRMAGIHETIEALPNGYETVLGEHGIGLSGGQRQRLAIARALLKRPRILIFDEATSQLDAPTAERLAHTVNRLRGKVSILFIAHHIPAALRIDRRLMVGRRESPTAAAKGQGNRVAPVQALRPSVP